jgi:hypothetical protein
MRKIELNGEWIAILLEDDEGKPIWIVPPLVFDEDDNLIEGHDVVEAVIQSGKGVEMPQIRGATPGYLAQLDQFLANVAEQLGTTVGPPDPDLPEL